jgi:sarcosine oxidase
VTTESASYAIVGAGLAGAAAAWRLAQSGAEVIVLERDRPASELGSSHGSARIFRYAYPEQFYTDLVVQSKAGWDELETASGRRLITPSGALDFGAVRDPARLATVLERAGVEHEMFSAAEARVRWPQLAFDTEALWHPGAGVIDAESSVNAMLDLAQAAGARVFIGWEVERVERGAGAGYVLSSASGDTVHAEQVIVAAGGWLPALLADLALPAGFAERMPQFEVRQENAFHFPYRDERQNGEAPRRGSASWPTFIYKGEDIQVYGLPGGRDAEYRGQKIAEYNGGRAIASASEQDRRIDPANRRGVRARSAARIVRRDHLPLHQRAPRGHDHRPRRGHHHRLALLRAGRQVRPAARRTRLRPGRRHAGRPRTLPSARAEFRGGAG